MNTHPQNLVKHLTEKFSYNKFFSKYNDFSLISCYYHTWEMQFPIGMHSHTFYEINIITSGIGYHYIEKQCLEVKIGDVFVIPPSVTHGYYTNEPTFEIFHILIHPAFFDRYKYELQQLPGFTTLFETEPYFREFSDERLFLSLSTEQFHKATLDFNELASYNNLSNKDVEIKKIAKVLYLITCFSELIYTYHHNENLFQSLNTDAVFIIRTLDYIKQNYANKICVDDLASIANMSRSTFIRQFKKFCKSSPIQYIMQVRIEKSIEYLENTNKTITEISQECGFFDNSHFSKIFKEFIGQSAKDYKALHGKTTKKL